jgi:hypothetical protein
MATFTHKRIATHTTGFQEFLDNDTKFRYDTLETMAKTLRFANGGIRGKVLLDPKELALLLKKPVPSTAAMIALDGTIVTKDGEVFGRNANKEKFADLRALLDDRYIQADLSLLYFNHPEWFANMFMLDDIWITPNAKQRDNLDNTFYLPESVTQCYRYAERWSFENIAGLAQDDSTTDISYSVVLTDEQRKRIVASYHYHKDTFGVKKEKEKLEKGKAILSKYTPEELEAIKKALG